MFEHNRNANRKSNVNINSREHEGMTFIYNNKKKNRCYITVSYLFKTSERRNCIKQEIFCSLDGTLWTGIHSCVRALRFLN